MPAGRLLASAAFALALSAARVPAHAQQAEKPAAAHAARVKPRAAAPAADNGFMHVDDWFSYGPPKEAEVEREAPGVQLKVHDPHEDDIIVYGLRQKRDFEGVARDPNLTSPQGLDAAQPVVPGIGDSCSYKTGCFDSGQTPLRTALFGD